MLGPWLATLIRSDEQGVLIVDRRQRIVMLNREASHIFGYQPEALLDRRFDALFPEPLRSAYSRHLARFSTTRIAGRRLRVKLDLQGRRANGEDVYVGASLSRLLMHQQVFLSVIVCELTPHQRPASTALPLQKLAGSLQQATEIEKRSFSRALYGDLGQRLSALKLDVDWCVRHAGKAPVAERLAQMQGLLEDIIGCTRTIASNLRPPLLDDLGLSAALEWLTDRFQTRTGIVCALECCTADLPDGVVESALFRIVQEALLNIEQHSQARNVLITLWNKERWMHVVVEDDGVGLARHPDAPALGLGLPAMQERVAMLGGHMRLKSIEPSGVALLVALPLASTNGGAP